MSISRRDFLKLVGGMAGYLALRPFSRVLPLPEFPPGERLGRLVATLDLVSVPRADAPSIGRLYPDTIVPGCARRWRRPTTRRSSTSAGWRPRRAICIRPMSSRCGISPTCRCRLSLPGKAAFGPKSPCRMWISCWRARSRFPLAQTRHRNAPAYPPVLQPGDVGRPDSGERGDRQHHLPRQRALRQLWGCVLGRGRGASARLRRRRLLPSTPKWARPKNGWLPT